MPLKVLEHVFPAPCYSKPRWIGIYILMAQQVLLRDLSALLNRLQEG